MVERLDSIDQGSDLWLEKWGFDPAEVLRVFERFVACKRRQIAKTGEMPFPSAYWHLKDILFRLLSKQRGVKESLIQDLCDTWAWRRASDAERQLKRALPVKKSA